MLITLLQITVGGKVLLDESKSRSLLLLRKEMTERSRPLWAKLNVQPVTGVEEVNMFKEDGTVLHFELRGEFDVLAM